MKNNSSTTTTTNNGGRFFFSSWTSPQNPIITLLKRRRESKASAQADKNSPGPIDTKQQHKQQQPHVQTSFNITSSSSSTTSTPKKTTITDNANEYLLKRNTQGFQPMRIEEYEPGHSSIALKESVVEHPDYNPPICKPGELCRYSESKDSKNFRIRKKIETTNGFPVSTKTTQPSRDNNNTVANGDDKDIYDDDDDDTIKQVLRNRSVNKENPHVVYKNVQAGGVIPEKGLRNFIETRRVKTLPASSSSSTNTNTMVMKKSLTGLPNGGTADLQRIFHEQNYSRLGRKKTREELDEELRMKKKMVDNIIAKEKLKKLEEEKRSNEARRHNDNFLAVEKSPVKLNRYDDDTINDNNKKFRKGKFRAVAMYNFKAKNERELGLRKGDTVHVLKQIDKNWFEGDCNGIVGIFPISYVKIHLQTTRNESTLRGRVLYDFNANAPPELSLYKGERITIIGTIDDNWVEGRSRNGEGIFPLNYVRILDDDEDCGDDDLSRSSSLYGTPVPSRTATPSFDQRNAHSRLSLRERPKEDFRVSSPVGSIVSSYAPTIPSAPLSPFGSQDLDTTMGSYAVSDWPSLEASLLDLEKISISQLMQRQQQRHQATEQQHLDKRMATERTLERAASLQQKYRPYQRQQQYHSHQQQESLEQKLRREQLLQMQREVQQKRTSQQRHAQLDRFQEGSRDFSRKDFLSQSAHPDLCVGGNSSKNSPPMRDSNIIRSATNSGLSEKNRSYYTNQSSPYNRYPSLISKDPVVIDNEASVKKMMARQSEAVTREFLTRHTSNASLPRSSTPLLKHSIPIAKDPVRCESVLQRPASGKPNGYFSSESVSTVKSGGKGTTGDDMEEMFYFKEIKLKPMTPDYSKTIYKIETRTSLPGGRSDTPPSITERRISSPLSTMGPREVSPMKSYEWHKVLYDYKPYRLDEIDLRKGDMVQVVEKCGDGWWLGISQTSGKLGLFPGNHVIKS